jgi:hypothetical protein
MTNKATNKRSNLKQQAMALKSRPLKRLLFRFCGRCTNPLSGGGWPVNLDDKMKAKDYAGQNYSEFIFEPRRVA